MKMNLTIEIDTDSNGDRELIEELVNLLQQLQGAYTEEEDQ